MSEGFDVIPEQVALPVEAWAKACEHALQLACRGSEGPEESVGLLTQMNGRGPIRYHPCLNVAENKRNSYVLDHEGHMRIASDRPWKVVGIVHSHPEGEPRPSHGDSQVYVPERWLYGVIGIAAGQPTMGMFRYVRGNFMMCKLVLV